MKGGPNRRFPRTAQAMSQAELRPGATIERDKIRRGRPKDVLYDMGDRTAEQDDPLTEEDGAIIIGDTDHGWYDEGTGPAGDPS